MNAKVIDLDEARKALAEGPDYWVCNCGCVVFYYRKNDTLICVECGTDQDVWTVRLDHE